MSIPMLKIESIARLKLAELRKKILEARKPKLGEVSIGDFTIAVDYPKGVYVFFDSETEGQCIYVGKVASRSFIGRIPSHVEPKKEFWMNQLSRHLGGIQDGENYESGRRKALRSCLLLIGFSHETDEAKIEERKQKINILESVLRSYLQPKLNATKSRYDGTELVEGLINK